MWAFWCITNDKEGKIVGIILTSRTPFSVDNPYRSYRPTTSKIIFLSMEGSVTEEEYFEWISSEFDMIKTKIQFISVAEDAVHTHVNNRTSEQVSMLGKSKPKQLVEKIDNFKLEKKDIYQFEKYPEDEFWIVTDVDKNLSNDAIDDFHEALDRCEEKGYGYAISNPFFELWLLLHHDNVVEDDRNYAVTEEHEYEATSHFRERLRKKGVPLKDKKHIRMEHYTKEKVFDAIRRAKELHVDKSKRYPLYLATTVYQLLDKIVEMLSEDT